MNKDYLRARATAFRAKANWHLTMVYQLELTPNINKSIKEEEIKEQRELAQQAFAAAIKDESELGE